MDQLRQALASPTAVIDQAMGIVMALGRLPANEAWNVLREVTQRTNSKLHLVSQLLTAWAESGELHLGVRIALEEAVRGRKPGRGVPVRSALAEVSRAGYPHRVGPYFGVPVRSRKKALDRERVNYRERPDIQSTLERGPRPHLRAGAPGRGRPCRTGATGYRL